MTFCAINIDDLKEDVLSLDEWSQLEEIESILAPFQEVTKRLEGNAKECYHGSIWEALPAVEVLLMHLERLKEIHKTGYIATSVNLAWAKLEEYYKLMNNTPAYAVALFLHPKFRFNYFKRRWTTKTLKPYLKPTLLAIRKLYDTEYWNNVTEIALQALSAKKQEKEDIFTAFLNQDIQSNDEFETYVNGTPLAVGDDFNPIKWWANTGSPQLMNMAFDILSIPAMSSETERVFSGAKLTLSPSRNRLSEDIIEATECLNRWYKAGL
jgi:hAT family C-terminal dimerisation region